jgi:SAM-dependent methyltransferase
MKPNFFSDGSPYLSHPLLTPERTKAEVDFILAELNLNHGDNLLDVGCGSGRHALDLAGRGFQVVGIDPSKAMIQAARQAAFGMENKPLFVQARAEEFKTGQKFKAALCLFTTLGQIEDGGDNRALINKVFNLLSPDGCFIVEIPHPEWVKVNLVSEEYIPSQKGVMYIERSFSETDNTVTEIFTRVSRAERRVYLLKYRLFSLEELTSMLEKCGFSIAALYGGYQDLPAGPDHPSILVFSTT